MLLKGINLFGDLHHTGTLTEIQAMPDLNIVKPCSRELSWILNTYFKNQLPPSETKPCLNISDASKATCTSFSSCFLGKQRGDRHQRGNLVMFWLPIGKGGGRTPVPPRERAGKCGKCRGSWLQCAFEGSQGIPTWSSRVLVQNSCSVKPHFTGEWTHCGSWVAASGEGEPPRRRVVARGI